MLSGFSLGVYQTQSVPLFPCSYETYPICIMAHISFIFQGDSISFAVVVAVLDRHGLRPGEAETLLEVQQIDALVHDIFYTLKAKEEEKGKISTTWTACAELTLNLLFQIYDR